MIKSSETTVCVREHPRVDSLMGTSMTDVIRGHNHIIHCEPILPILLPHSGPCRPNEYQRRPLDSRRTSYLKTTIFSIDFVMGETSFKAIIVGGGPVGLMAAHALEKANIDFV